MILWFFGLFLLSSVFIIGAFLSIAWHSRKPFSAYNAPLMLALFLDLHAVAFALISGMRMVDILSGRALNSESTVALVITYSLLLVAKTGIVWVAALQGERNYSKKIWWGYWFLAAAWTLLCP